MTHTQLTDMPSDILCKIIDGLTDYEKIQMISTCHTIYALLPYIKFTNKYKWMLGEKSFFKKYNFTDISISKYYFSKLSTTYLKKLVIVGSEINNVLDTEYAFNPFDIEIYKYEAELQRRRQLSVDINTAMNCFSNSKLLNSISTLFLTHLEIIDKEIYISKLPRTLTHFKGNLSNLGNIFEQTPKIQYITVYSHRGTHINYLPSSVKWLDISIPLENILCPLPSSLETLYIELNGKEKCKEKITANITTFRVGNVYNNPENHYDTYAGKFYDYQTPDSVVNMCINYYPSIVDMMEMTFITHVYLMNVTYEMDIPNFPHVTHLWIKNVEYFVDLEECDSIHFLSIECTEDISYFPPNLKYLQIANVSNHFNNNIYPQSLVQISINVVVFPCIFNFHDLQITHLTIKHSKYDESIMTHTIDEDASITERRENIANMVVQGQYDNLFYKLPQSLVHLHLCDNIISNNFTCPRNISYLHVNNKIIKHPFFKRLNEYCKIPLAIKKHSTFFVRDNNTCYSPVNPMIMPF